MSNFILVSDLHIDINQYFSADIFDSLKEASELSKTLVIAGDTANSAVDAFNFFKQIIPFYNVFMFVDGNHEHYSNRELKIDIPENESLIDILTRDLKIKFPKKQIFNLSKSSYQSHDTTFIGANGWYAFHEDYMGMTLESQLDHWRDYMNDSYRCNFSSPVWLAERDFLNIKKRMILAEKKLVIVTHTAPHSNSTENKPYDRDWTIANGYYYNHHFQSFIENNKQLDITWCHGHVHQSQDYDIGGHRVVCNPRGYGNENPGWKPVLIGV